MTVYAYSIEDDFPNKKVTPDKFDSEIRASAIVTALDGVNTDGDVCSVVFRADLSAGDKTILDGVVAAHQGEPTRSFLPVVLGSPSNPKDHIPVVAMGMREGDEVLYCTHNFCDPTTWYCASERVTDEVLADSGDGLTFGSAHVNWIDVVSGKLMDELGIREDQVIFDPTHPHQYLVVVTVDSVEATMREPLEASGGDYTVDYATGKVVFFTSQTGKTVKASYSYENGSTWRMRPIPGKCLDMETAEGQFTDDCDMLDTFEYTLVGFVQVFAPELWDGYTPPGPLPTNTLIPLLTEQYMRMSQFVDNAYGSYPVIPAIGGASRGLQHAMYGFPFRYSTLRRITALYGMELQVSLKHDRAFGGERVTATFYCVSRDEASVE